MPPYASQEGLHPCRVLVVDDHVDSAETLGHVLSAYGYNVSLAFTPEQALEVSQDFQPQVAVLDINLPHFDGHVLAGKIRQLPGMDECVCVAVTGYLDEEYRERSERQGFRGHLVKPIEVQALLELLSTKH